MADFSTTVVTQVTQAVVLSTVQQVVQVNSAIPGNYLSAPRLGFGIYSVKDPIFGAVGDGVTDDTAAIQAAIDAAPNMGVVFFPTPSVNYLISDTLVLKSGVIYQGTTFNTATIKLADGANPDALLASVSWYNNSPAAGNPIIIRDLHIDGNSDNNSSGHGIILTNFRCLLERVQVRHVAQTGVWMTDTTRDLSVISGTMVDNTIKNCFISDCGEYGIYCQDATAVVTDGFLQDCNIESVGLDSVRIDHSTGWLVDGNHFWGTQPQYAIRMRNCDRTRITNNYVERFGDSAGTWEGIFAHTSKDVICAGNVVANTNTTVGSTFAGIRITTATFTAHAVVANNLIRGNADAQIAFILTTTGGGTLYALVVGNQSFDCATAVSAGTNTNVSYGENQWELQPPTFTSLDTTPNVNRSNLFRTANAGATSITDFDQAVEGQMLTVFVQDTHTTFVHDVTKIVLQGGIDYLARDGDSISFRSVNGVWIETSRTTLRPRDVMRSITFADSPTTANRNTGRTVFADASSGNITLALETAVSPVSDDGKIFTIVKTDSSANTVTIDPNSTQTVNGASTYVLKRQYQWVTVQSNGTEWFVVSASRSVQSWLAKTTTYSVLDGDDGLFLGGTSWTLTLQSAATRSRPLTLRCTASGTITIARAGSDTIEGASTSLTMVAGERITLMPNGTDWLIVG